MVRDTVNPRFQCAGMWLSRIWHCFGGEEHLVDLETVVRMLDASQTNLLPINTHLLKRESGREALLIGFGDVTYDALSARLDLSQFVKLINVNQQVTAEAAITQAMLAIEMTGEKILKLEVLNPDRKTSNDAALLGAVRDLLALRSDLTILPLLSASWATAERLVGLGCPLLRVMGSPIGSRAGLTERTELRRICELGLPVILDGGVGCAAHFLEAVELGAAGCLVNSMLFAGDGPPEAILHRFMRDIPETLLDSWGRPPLAENA